MITQFKDNKASFSYGRKISRTMEALATSTVQERKRVCLLIENGPHTLQIIPNGDGPVPIKEVIVYHPPKR